MKNKIFNKTVKYTFIILLISFLAIYFSISAGYFEYTNGKKVELTNKQIEKFEKDISAGKNIDASKYVIEKSNYQNNISKAGLTISNVSYKIVSKGLGAGFKALEKLTSSS